MLQLPIAHIYIIICTAAVLLIAAATAWLIVRHRRQRRFSALYEEQCQPVDINSRQWPKISVVIVSQERAVALERALPSILDQSYPDFEVIVVDAASTDATHDAIKRLSQRYDNLRRTFITPDSQIADMDQFALMLGLRAARTEWVVITTPGAEPDSDEWLMRMARHIDDTTDLIIGTGQGEGVINLCMRKSIYADNNHTLDHLEKRYACTYEWSPQACIYQRE